MTLRGSVILCAALLTLVTTHPATAQDTQDESEWLGYVHIYTGISQTHGTNSAGDVTYDVGLEHSSFDPRILSRRR